MATIHIEFDPVQSMTVAPQFAPFIRTLIVDDTPAMTMTIAAIFQQHPWVHVVGTEENGLDAVKAALSEHPELVVMDLNMPVMNGLKATMHIKQRLPETKVILISTEDSPEIALAAMDCGADGFIPKHSLVRKRDWHIRRLFADDPQAMVAGAKIRRKP